MKKRGNLQKIKDLVTFPIRAFTLFDEDRWGLSSLRSERFYYAAEEVVGYCLDIGCCSHNVLINEFLDGNGKGIDIYPYEGLTKDHLVESFLNLPFEDKSFDSVTFIANINHAPENERDAELAEVYRVLKPGGNIVIQTAWPLASIAAHIVGHYLDKNSADRIRGMEEGETFYITEKELRERLTRAGFKDIKRKSFATQWFLNRVYVAWKK